MREKKKPLNAYLVLIVVLIIFGMTPLGVGVNIIESSSRTNEIDNIKHETQSRGTILSDKLSRAGYIQGKQRDINRLSEIDRMDSEIGITADFYDARIIVIDSSYRIIRDTFGISERRFTLAPEVIRTFRGESSDTYDKDNHCMIQTFPIYGSEESSDIEGVMLMTVSTLAADVAAADIRKKAHLVIISGLIVIAAAAVLIVRGFLYPFRRVSESLNRVSTGDLNALPSDASFDLTESISDGIRGTVDRLKTLEESADEFVSNVSHELKTPITSIKVLADSLSTMEDVPSDLYKEFMDDISREVDREAAIIDDLLTIVKDDNEQAIDYVPVDLIAIIKLVLRRIKPLADARNIQITLETAGVVIAEGDENRLIAAFSNLAENAVKYNVNQGRINIKAGIEGDDAVVTVKDTGIGIPREHLELVFERFYRVDKARSRGTGGTGLGLAITKKTIQMHGGTITAESIEGMGTTFTVRIPRIHSRNSD